MLVDDYDKYNNDRQDVVDINADEAVEDVEAEPMADDCTLDLSYFFCVRCTMGTVDRLDSISNVGRTQVG